MNHPVTFEWAGIEGIVACSVCGAAVPSAMRWQELHRKNHDDHNMVHGNIDEAARRYVSPPRYG